MNTEGQDGIDAMSDGLYYRLDTTSTELRLLRMSETGNLHIEAYDIDCAPNYYALSYAWREKSAANINRNIDIWHRKNRYTINITDNLWSFFQLRFTREPQVYLWVDSICINQTDTIEKSHQVGLMKQIYERATKVIVWLGTLDAEKTKLARSKYFSGRTFLDCVNGFDREYWHRVWIVQEFLLARELLICIGDFSYNFGELSTEVVRISSVSDWHPEMTTLEITVRDLHELRKERFNPTDGRKKSCSTDDSGRTNMSKILHVKNEACQDVRDRIYGLLGVFPVSGLMPDYSMDPETLFVKCMISTASMITLEVAMILRRKLELQMRSMESLLVEVPPVLKWVCPITWVGQKNWQSMGISRDFSIKTLAMSEETPQFRVSRRYYTYREGGDFPTTFQNKFRSFSVLGRGDQVFTIDGTHFLLICHASEAYSSEEQGKTAVCVGVGIDCMSKGSKPLSAPSYDSESDMDIISSLEGAEQVFQGSRIRYDSTHRGYTVDLSLSAFVLAFSCYCAPQAPVLLE